MENIRKYRGKSHLTQKQLADKVGCTRTEIVNLESDLCRHTPNARTAANLAGIFGISVCDLFGYDNLIYPPKSKEQAKRLISEIASKWDL
jgi:DNA-binding XRE family transcriptional regulator